MPAAPRHVAAAACVFAIALVAACSLDWSARPDEAEAGTDSGHDGPAPGDGSPDDRDAGDADAPPDGPEAVCANLAVDLATLRSRARACDTINAADECKTTVLDECACKVVIDKPESAQPTVDYDDAVKRFAAANCDAGCAASCPAPNADTVVSSSWVCTQAPDGKHCFP